jgi:hypothetical protein
MQFTIHLVDQIDPVAIYAAILSTLIFGWELYKWLRRGPKLRVNIASFLVKDNDVIEIREKSRELAIVLEAVGSGERDVPSYINADHKAMRAVFLRAPALGDIPYPVQMNPSMVVEFYSR